jgi:DegV family protein with EDD domain
MALVKVVTDSLADIPASMIKGLDITVVPCTVHFGNKSFRDKLDLKMDEFYRLLAASPMPPTTSNPAPGVFEDAYTRLAESTNQIISIHVSSELSGTWNAARLSADTIRRNLRVQISVIDSQQLSMAQGWLVILAARLAAKGLSLIEITKQVEEARSRARIIAMLDTLEYAERSGRLRKSAAKVTTMLNVKPLLSLTGGEVVPIGAARTQNGALDRLTELAAEMGMSDEVSIVHCYAEVLARRLKRLLMAQMPEDRITICETGPVSAAHVGPGAVCIAWLANK